MGLCASSDDALLDSGESRRGYGSTNAAEERRKRVEAYERRQAKTNPKKKRSGPGVGRLKSGDQIERINTQQAEARREAEAAGARRQPSGWEEKHAEAFGAATYDTRD